jgi:hypothetical protein
MSLYIKLHAASYKQPLQTTTKHAFWKLMVLKPEAYKFTVNLPCYADRDRIGRVAGTQVKVVCALRYDDSHSRTR